MRKDARVLSVRVEKREGIEINQQQPSSPTGLTVHAQIANVNTEGHKTT